MMFEKTASRQAGRPRSDDYLESLWLTTVGCSCCTTTGVAGVVGTTCDALGIIMGRNGHSTGPKRTGVEYCGTYE